jgi:hypothetical protein
MKRPPRAATKGKEIQALFSASRVSTRVIMSFGVVINKLEKAEEEDEYGLQKIPITKKLGEPVVVLEHVFKRMKFQAKEDSNLISLFRLFNHRAQGRSESVGGYHARARKRILPYSQVIVARSSG